MSAVRASFLVSATEAVRSRIGDRSMRAAATLGGSGSWSDLWLT